MHHNAATATEASPAASFSFLFLLIFLFREISDPLTKENDKEERERSEIVARKHEPDEYRHTPEVWCMHPCPDRVGAAGRLRRGGCALPENL
jgi:hypothetical protein